MNNRWYNINNFERNVYNKGSLIPRTYEYIVTEGPEPDTSYIHVADFAPILVYQSPRHVKHKLNEAMLEHCNYVRKMLARIKLSQNPQVVAELFIAWRDLTR